MWLFRVDFMEPVLGSLLRRKLSVKRWVTVRAGTAGVLLVLVLSRRSGEGRAGWVLER